MVYVRQDRTEAEAGLTATAERADGVCEMGQTSFLAASRMIGGLLHRFHWVQWCRPLLGLLEQGVADFSESQVPPPNPQFILLPQRFPYPCVFLLISSLWGHGGCSWIPLGGFIFPVVFLLKEAGPDGMNNQVHVSDFS